MCKYRKRPTACVFFSLGVHSAHIPNTVESLPPLLDSDPEDDDGSACSRATVLVSNRGVWRPSPLDDAFMEGAVAMASSSKTFLRMAASNMFLIKMTQMRHR